MVWVMSRGGDKTKKRSNQRGARGKGMAIEQ